MLKGKTSLPAGKLFLLGLIVFIFLVTIFTFGDKGLLRLWQLKRKALGLEQEIGRIDQDNQKLSQRIRDLKYDSGTVEKIAREDLGLAYPGEQIYKYDTTTMTGNSP